jgi:hypothetical protein
MKTITIIITLTATILVSAGCATPHSDRALEYKVVTAPIGGGLLQKEINKAAADGWVVVSTSGTGNTSDAYVVMKRAKQ